MLVFCFMLRCTILSPIIVKRLSPSRFTFKQAISKIFLIKNYLIANTNCKTCVGVTNNETKSN
jgi:hypothetical protein